MTKYKEEYRRHYPKAFGGVVLFLFMASYLITRSDKPREDFTHKSGTISYLATTPPIEFRGRKSEKDVFLVLNEYDKVFEMFTGTDKGDFSPRVNRLNELNIGDKVDIYFEITSKSKSEPVNRLLQYLDKDGELIYLRSKADKYIGYFILGSSGLLGIMGIYMKIKSD